MLTNRERGDRFDLWVLAQLEPFVTNLRQTIGSGSVFGDQDQVCEEFRISCKLRHGRGLTRAELTEPYGREAIGSYRCPLTVLRTERQTEDGIEWLDFAAADAPAFLTIYGRDLLALAIRSHLEDLEILEDWPAGLSLGLLDMTAPGKFLIVFELPKGSCTMIFTLHDFLNVLAEMAELRLEQRQRELGKEVEAR